MPMLPAVAHASLTAHPRTFLRRYPVRIAGAPLPSGIINYAIRNANFGQSQRPGSRLGTLNMHDTEAFQIDNQNMLVGFGFPAYSIQMVQSDVAVALFNVSGVDGPDILVTGALTGCTFIVDAGPHGSINCTHLQPNGEDSIQLHDRMDGNYTSVYGRHGYEHVNEQHPVTFEGNPAYDRTVSIIGVRRNGGWKVYAQKLDPLNAMSIRSVHRIYPAD